MRLLLVAVGMLGLSACATIPQPQQLNLQSDDPLTRQCAQLLQSLDDLVEGSGVADRGARSVNGFPYLRSNRFLASFHDELDNNSALQSAWISQMRLLDQQGRQFELANLPETTVKQTRFADTAAVLAELQRCGALLSAADSKYPERLAQLQRGAQIDADYSNGKRILGLYALTRYPFYWGVEEWQRGVSEAFINAREDGSSANIVRYAPAADSEPLSRRELQQLLARAALHPLGMPELSRSERERLFVTFAPIYEIDTAGDYDRIGAPVWADGEYAQVDVSRPVVFTRLDYTRYQQQTLLQLVYVVWMPERPRQHFLDLLGGNLDGLAWRVTLAPDGEVILYDSIHPCGCYHKFFPTHRLQPLENPEPASEWAFIPAELPAIDHGQRLTLSLQSRTHYLQNVWPEAEPRDGLTYAFADYDELRSLPKADGSYRSLFGPDGLVAGSERRERFLFWPMGIKSAGAMRQAGSQPTAFAGRRHFDDADLLEKRFRLLPPTD